MTSLIKEALNLIDLETTQSKTMLDQCMSYRIADRRLLSFINYVVYKNYYHDCGNYADACLW